MADIELVIKISSYDKEWITNGYYIPEEINMKISEAIANGTPLPKGHGDLIDVGEIRVIELEDSLHTIRHEKGDDVDVYIDAPTIIEADTESEQ